MDCWTQGFILCVREGDRSFGRSDCDVGNPVMRGFGVRIHEKPHVACDSSLQNKRAQFAIIITKREK